MSYTPTNFHVFPAVLRNELRAKLQASDDVLPPSGRGVPRSKTRVHAGGCSCAHVICCGHWKFRFSDCFEDWARCEEDFVLSVAVHWKHHNNNQKSATRNGARSSTSLAVLLPLAGDPVSAGHGEKYYGWMLVVVFGRTSVGLWLLWTPAIATTDLRASLPHCTEAVLLVLGLFCGTGSLFFCPSGLQPVLQRSTWGRTLLCRRWSWCWATTLHHRQRIMSFYVCALHT